MSINSLPQVNQEATQELFELNDDELNVVAGGKGKINTSKIGKGAKGAGQGLGAVNNGIGIANGIYDLTHKK